MLRDGSATECESARDLGRGPHALREEQVVYAGCRLAQTIVTSDVEAQVLTATLRFCLYEDREGCSGFLGSEAERGCPCSCPQGHDREPVAEPVRGGVGSSNANVRTIGELAHRRVEFQRAPSDRDVERCVQHGAIGGTTPPFPPGWISVDGFPESNKLLGRLGSILQRGRRPLELAGLVDGVSREPFPRSPRSGPTLGVDVDVAVAFVRLVEQEGSDARIRHTGGNQPVRQLHDPVPTGLQALTATQAMYPVDGGHGDRQLLDALESGCACGPGRSVARAFMFQPSGPTPPESGLRHDPALHPGGPPRVWYSGLL